MPYTKIAQILSAYDWQHLTQEEVAAKLEKDMPGILKELAVDFSYLSDWYRASVDETIPPIWTDGHIEEVVNDFYLIPKQENERE